MKRLAVLLFLTIFAAQAFGATVNLQWDPSPSASVVKYRVYRGISIGGAFSPIGDVAAPTVTFTDTPPADGRNHLYYVTGVLADGTETKPTNIVEEETPGPSNLRKRKP